jgi:putative addiction module component (TIGR02574 family)
MYGIPQGKPTASRHSRSAALSVWEIDHMSTAIPNFPFESLPVPERLDLVERIWNSIANEPDSLALSDEEKDELDRRLEAYEANPVAGSSWDEVKARLQSKP